MLQNSRSMQKKNWVWRWIIGVWWGWNPHLKKVFLLFAGDSAFTRVLNFSWNSAAAGWLHSVPIGRKHTHGKNSRTREIVPGLFFRAHTCVLFSIFIHTGSISVRQQRKGISVLEQPRPSWSWGHSRDTITIVFCCFSHWYSLSPLWIICLQQMKNTFTWIIRQTRKYHSFVPLV